MNDEIRQCQNCKQNFTIDATDFAFYKKIQVPPPTFCWLCRAQRRFAFRNERILYKRKSDFSGKDIFAMYAPQSGVKVYEKQEWLSDDWDPTSYGKAYDFSRSFFEQFKELLHEVPLKNLNIVNGTNSEYTNNITDPKNCYLVFNANKPEDCMYSHGITHSRECIDVSHVGKCELCYGSFWLTNCARTISSTQCENCVDVWFSKNCRGCTSCFGCSNLVNKSYCFLNEQYTKEEYQKKLATLGLQSYKNFVTWKQKTEESWLKYPNKFIEGSSNTNVSGNYISHSKNVRNSFLVREGENLRYCQYAQELPGSKDCHDYSIWGDDSQLVYETHASGSSINNVKFSLFTQEGSHDVEYSMVCSSSANLFGCISLKHKEYCVLNKQYSKEEYKALVARIKKQMLETPYVDAQGRKYYYGEYFPIEISPVAYNESMAQEYFLLTREEALRQGYRWKEDDERNYAISVSSDKLPDDITTVTDAICKETIGCAHEGKCSQLCTTAFRITLAELQFYKKFNLPLPRLCHNCRTFERLKWRTGLALHRRICQCAGLTTHFHGSNPCPNQFETSYAPDRPEIVYCEACYQSEVI